MAGSFFDLCKGKRFATRAIKLDAFRMKKYYSYYIKQNQGKGTSWLMIFHSRIGTLIHHIELSVWPVVSLIYAKVRGPLLEQLSLMHST